MATIALTRAYPTTDDYHKGSVRIFGSAAALTNTTNDVTDVLGPEYAGYTDRSAQVFGTLGIAGNLRIEGSLDGSNWATLTDPQGNALDFGAAKIEAISEATPYLRGRITAGDGTTALSVYFFLRQNRI